MIVRRLENHSTLKTAVINFVIIRPLEDSNEDEEE